MIILVRCPRNLDRLRQILVDSGSVVGKGGRLKKVFAFASYIFFWLP